MFFLLPGQVARSFASRVEALGFEQVEPGPRRRTRANGSWPSSRTPGSREPFVCWKLGRWFGLVCMYAYILIDLQYIFYTSRKLYP